MPKIVHPAHHHIAMFAALAGLALLAAPIEKALAQKPSSPVTIVNPDTSPVPTTVVNPATNPALTRDQDNPARHPYTAICQSAPVTGNSAQCSTAAIPVGEEVVIETISIFADGDASNSVFVPFITTTGAGSEIAYALNAISDNGSLQPSFATYQEAQALRLYADPGSTIKCSGTTRGNNSSFGLGIVCTISGYYVSLQ